MTNKLVHITKKQHDQLVKKAVRNLRILEELGYTSRMASLTVYGLTKAELEKDYAM